MIRGVLRSLGDLGVLGRALGEVPRRRRALGTLAPLLPVSFSTALAATHPPRRLRALARRYPFELALNELLNREVPRGRPAHRVENPAAILPAGGAGVLVCAVHLGPFHQVTGEILRRRDTAAVFASRHIADRLQREWRAGARTHRKELEVLVSDERRSVPRALRLLAGGGCVIVYVDADNRVRGLGSRGGGTVDLSFLGLPLRVSSGPARLAARAGARTVLAASWRERGLRVVVRFSNPLPPLTEASEEAVAERVRGTYAWFEPFVRVHPEQWDGWLPQVLSWSRTGSPPSTTRARFEAERLELEALVRSGRSDVRLAAEPAHVGWLARGDERLLVHGPRRLILKGDRLAAELLEAALRRWSLSTLRRISAEKPERVAEALTRLELAGLLTIQAGGRRRPGASARGGGKSTAPDVPAPR
jgi:hypothetical protein